MHLNNYALILFFSSLSQFNTFVDPIQAGGGGDGPEDVMGGLKVSLSKLNWQTSSAKVNQTMHANGR